MQIQKPINNRINLFCRQCSREFEVPNCRKETAKFCSKECFGEGMKGHVPWNKKNLDEKEIIKLYKEEISPRRISEKFNCSQSSIYRILHKHDLIKECGLIKSGRHRKFMSDARKGENNPMYGKTGWRRGLTKETDERIRIGAEKLKGRKLSNEHRLKAIKNLRFNKIGEFRGKRISPLKITCNYCGKNFLQYKNRKDKRKYCSPQCYRTAIKNPLQQKRILCVCGCGQEINHLSKYGRPTRFVQGHNNRGIKQTYVKKRVENRIENDNYKHTEKTKQKLREYNKRNRLGKTFKEIYGLKKAKEILQKMSLARNGEKNPAWLGGKSFELYSKSFNNKFKRKIRKRDNQICMLCGIHKEKLNRALVVHHINYNKKMSIPQNCISLCLKCHNGIVHADKNKLGYWKTFFQSSLTEKYGYQYSENQEIILGVKNEI